MWRRSRRCKQELSIWTFRIPLESEVGVDLQNVKDLEVEFRG